MIIFIKMQCLKLCATQIVNFENNKTSLQSLQNGVFKSEKANQVSYYELFAKTKSVYNSLTVIYNHTVVEQCLYQRYEC